MPSTGTPELKIACGARGEPSLSTDSGPPERITAFGFISREGGFRLLERHDLGIDALLAHAARDQLRHLAAEIDDQNLVMGRGHEGVDGWLIGRAGCHGKELRDRGEAGNR